MLKVVSGIAIIAFTTFCGYLLARKYRQRKQFFTQLNAFNERFLNEIAYYRRPIKVFSGNYVYQGEFNALLEEFFKNVEEYSKNDRTLLPLSAYSFLTKEDEGIVQDYFLMLGRGDSSSQKAYFSSIKEPLSKLQAEAESACKRYGDLYVKIGFLCGLLILIIIV